jgi:hypothetical protein
MAARTKARLSAHLAFRRAILADAGEAMFAALQLQVAGCAHCASRACTDATHSIVSGIREALRVDREARRAECARDRRPAAGDARSAPMALVPLASRVSKH